MISGKDWLAKPDAKRYDKFQIHGYEWGWTCDECGTIHDDLGTGITDGDVLECLNCGTRHSVSIDTDKEI